MLLLLMTCGSEGGKELLVAIRNQPASGDTTTTTTRTTFLPLRQSSSSSQLYLLHHIFLILIPCSVSALLVGRSSVVTFVLAIFIDTGFHNQNHPLTHPPLITSYSLLCMLPRALFLHSTFTPRWWWSSSPSSSSSHRRRVVSVLLAVVCIPEQSRELNKWLVFVAHFHFSHPPPSPYDADDGKVLFPLHCHTSSHVLSSVHTHSL